MQCTNCGFENIPGSEACGRCGSSMRIGTMVMDVKPPRASGWRKSVRRNLPTGRRLYQGAQQCAESARDGAIVVGARGAATAGEMIAELRQAPKREIRDLPARAVFSRALIPGALEIYCGQRALGVAKFFAFLLMFCAAIVCLEYRIGGPLMGLVFGVHASSVGRVVIRYFQPKSRGLRFVYAIATAIILVVLLYIPAAFMLAQMLHVRVRWTWMV